MHLARGRVRPSSSSSDAGVATSGSKPRRVEGLEARRWRARRRSRRAACAAVRLAAGGGGLFGLGAWRGPGLLRGGEGSAAHARRARALPGRATRASWRRARPACALPCPSSRARPAPPIGVARSPRSPRRWGRGSRSAPASPSSAASGIEARVLVAQVEHDLLRRLACRPRGCAGEGAWGRHRATAPTQLGSREHGRRRTPSAICGPTPRSRRAAARNSSRVRLVGEAEQELRVLAHDQVRPGAQAADRRRARGERARRPAQRGRSPRRPTSSTSRAGERSRDVAFQVLVHRARASRYFGGGRRRGLAVLGLQSRESRSSVELVASAPAARSHRSSACRGARPRCAARCRRASGSRAFSTVRRARIESSSS